MTRFVLGILILCFSFPALAAAPDTQPAPKVRTFQFTYAAVVTGLKPGRMARIWLPVPSSSSAQEIEIVSKELPSEGCMEKEKQHGNRILYLEAKANDKGAIPLRLVYRVKRREVKRDANHQTKEDAQQLESFLQPNRRVPIKGKPLDLLKGTTLPNDEMGVARVCYDAVKRHMRYSKQGIGWGNGDSLWACEQGYGNCSDFHSLFISLARAQHIPAKFDIGFLLPAKHGSGEIAGYHCWAQFHLKDKGWLPVDISEASKNPKQSDYYFGNLTEDRVAFNTGRDLELVPKQSGPALNFFIYPYVEVEGKVYPQSKIDCRFSFRDEH